MRGEAGLGKTALLEYAADRADGMKVLRVTGVEAESDLAFAGLHGLVWPIIDERRNLAEPQRAALEAALGLARGDGGDRFCVGRVLLLLPAAAESQPILCVVHDAQWLDVPSRFAGLRCCRLVARGIVIIFGAVRRELWWFDRPSLDELVLTGLIGSVLPLCSVAAAVKRWLRCANDCWSRRQESAGPAQVPAGSQRHSSPAVRRCRSLPLTRPCAWFPRRIGRLPESTPAASLVAASEDAGESG